MSIAKFLETFIFRDILSYIVPGMLNLIALIVIVKNDTTSSVLYKIDFSQADRLICLSLFFAICYTLGYIGSATMFIIRIYTHLDRPKVKDPNKGIKNKMKKVFGDWTEHEQSKDLISLCAEYVQINTPEIYFEKIERRVTLRNFEVGLSFTSLLYALTIFFFTDLNKLLAIIPILVFIIFISGSRYTSGEIDDFSFRLFLNSSIRTQDKSKEENNQSN